MDTILIDSPTNSRVPADKPLVLAPPFVQHNGRRDYTLAYKIQVIKETMVRGVSVSVVARRHNINSNVLFRWRAMYRRGELRDVQAPLPAAEASDGFIALGVVGKDGRLVKPSEDGAQSTSSGAAPAGSVVEIELAGGIKLRFDASIAAEDLRRVLGVAREIA